MPQSSQFKNSLRIAVVGTGAIGGYYGGRLAKQYDTHFFARSDVTHLRQYGLKVDSVQGDFILPKLSASTLEEPTEPFDLIIVAVKTTSNLEIAAQLSALIHTSTVVLIIQNGLHVEETFHRHLPNTRLVGGLAFICAQKKGPGWVEHQDYGTLKIGNYHKTSNTDLNELRSLFEACGITCTVTPNLSYTRWEKLVWNVPFASLCVINNCTTQALLSDPTHRHHLKQLMQEVIQIAVVDGHELPMTLAEEMLKNTDKMVDYAPSTLLDYRSGKPIELDAIFKEPMRVASNLGVKAPRFAEVVEQLSQL